MPKIIDLTGQTFGALTVVERGPSIRSGSGWRAGWVLRCECGNTTTATTNNLKAGHPQSCGCLTSALISKARLARPKRHCSVPECGGPNYGHGLCHKHYRRWKRHGDPLAGGTYNGDPEAFLSSVALQYRGEECLIWPFAKTGGGYANIYRDGANQVVSRIVCEAKNGPAPSPEHHAAHTCHCGHIGCVTWGHLEWQTPAENLADRPRLEARRLRHAS